VVLCCLVHHESETWNKCFGSPTNIRVEVDKTYIGGREEGFIGREIEKKSIVAVAVEMNERNALGRVHLRRVLDVSEDSLIPFVCEVVEQGFIVHTDGGSSYRSLSNLGYKHEMTILSVTSNPAQVSMLGFT